MASNFGLTVSSPQVNIIQSLNYLLATQANAASSVVNYNGNVLVANTATGSITSVYANGAAQTGTISYLYGYVDVKYANSATGSSGFTSNSAYANYYGVYNNKTGIESSNPADYQWTQVSGGFGNTKTLWYTTGGGNTINFFVGNAAPNIYYEPVIDNLPILLAIVANSTVVTNSIQPAAITNVQVAGNTITGYNIQLGTITANLIAANTIFVNQSLQSSNATFDSPTSNGFWLDASNGSARFGGNTNIGNNLTVGNNASIGGNLTVSGLLTAGTLNNNTVGTSTIANNSVSFGNAVTSVISNTYTTWTVDVELPYTYSQPQITTTSPTTLYINGAVYVLLQFESSGEFQWYMNFVRKNITTSATTNLFSAEFQFYNSYSVVAYTFGFPVAYLDTPSPGNYEYYVSLTPLNAPYPSSPVQDIYLGPGTIVIQQLKR